MKNLDLGLMTIMWDQAYMNPITLRIMHFLVNKI